MRSFPPPLAKYSSTQRGLPIMALAHSLCLMLPIAIGTLWQHVPTASQYTLWRHARDLFSPQMSAAALLDPTYTLILATFAKLGMPLHTASTLFGYMGWGGLALLLFLLEGAWGRPLHQRYAALLTATTPLLIATATTNIPWILLVACGALLAARHQRWGVQNVCLLVLLLLWFDPAVLLYALTLWWRQRRAQRESPRPLYILGALILVGWFALGAGQNASSLATYWTTAVKHVWLASPLYLFVLLPTATVGLASHTRQTQAAIAIVSLALIASATPFTQAAIGVGTYVFASQGVEHLSERLFKGQKHGRFALSLVFITTLLAAHGQTFWQWHTQQPEAQLTFDREVGSWLRAETKPNDVIFAPDSVLYWAQRPTTDWLPIGTEGEPGTWLGRMMENRPAYIVSTSTDSWTQLINTNWMQERYTKHHTFTMENGDSTPQTYTVWAYQLSKFDWHIGKKVGESLPFNIDIPRYSNFPYAIDVGNPIYVNVHLEATAPISHTYASTLSLVSLADGSVWDSAEKLLPSNLPVTWWQPGQINVERYQLDIPTNLPTGGYAFELALTDPTSGSMETVTLGYSGAPWTGTLTNQRPVFANFDSRVLLQYKTIAGLYQPGETIEVGLYWKALWPQRHRYIIHVNLLDDAGNVIVHRETEPMDGAYPTNLWESHRVLIYDPHPILIPEELPAGTYHIEVQMYMPHEERFFRASSTIDDSVDAYAWPLETITID